MTAGHFIDSLTDLTRLAAQLANEPELALDTEFMRESTYHPKLCLVQLAARGQTFCIDPLAIEDLTPLGQLLANANILKVLHAARQDVEVLLTRCKQLPANLFDTQVAAALIGLPPQVGYGELVLRLLDIKLEKDQTRTDWSKRPLSAEQLSYAADDVRHLLPLRERLQTELEKRGRWPWFETEMGRLADPAIYRTDPDQAWRRIKGLDTLDPRRFAAAKALTAWRETRAMQRDRPRGWILADEALREIIDVLPENADDLTRIRTLPRGVLDKCGADIMTALDSAAHLPRDDSPRRFQRPDPAQQALLKALGAKVREVAEQVSLSPEVLATQKDLKQLIAGQMDVEPLRGWRRDVVGEALLKLL